MLKIATAITRLPAPNFAEGLTTAELGQPDYEIMCRQHQAYVAVLEQLGVEVIILEPLAPFPDAHFVEDTAVLTPELAVITRPGVPSRRGETAEMAPVLAQFKSLACIEAPGTLEGGDVAQAGKHLFIGLSERSNEEGAAQLGRLLEPWGYTWSAVAVGAGLHLKSSVNVLGDDVLLLTAEFADHPAFEKYERIVVDAGEAYGANCLVVNRTILMARGFPSLRASLERLGMPVLELDMSESKKMDGGLTCLSLRF